MCYNLNLILRSYHRGLRIIWLMSFNLSKCEHLIITNKRLPIISDDHIEGCIINKIDSCKYFEVTITNNSSWSKNIANIMSKAHSAFFRGMFILSA